MASLTTATDQLARRLQQLELALDQTQQVVQANNHQQEHNTQMLERLVRAHTDSVNNQVIASIAFNRTEVGSSTQLTQFMPTCLTGCTLNLQGFDRPSRTCIRKNLIFARKRHAKLTSCNKCSKWSWKGICHLPLPQVRHRLWLVCLVR